MSTGHRRLMLIRHARLIAHPVISVLAADIINVNQLVLFSFREPRPAWKRRPIWWTRDGYDGKTKSDWTSIVDDGRFGNSRDGWYFRRDPVAGRLGNVSAEVKMGRWVL